MTNVPKKPNRDSPSASELAIRQARGEKGTEVTPVTDVTPVTKVTKPKKERSNVTMPADVMEYLKVMSWINRTDVTKYINVILKEHMENNIDSYNNAKVVFENFNKNI